QLLRARGGGGDRAVRPDQRGRAGDRRRGAGRGPGHALAGRLRQPHPRPLPGLLNRQTTMSRTRALPDPDHLPALRREYVRQSPASALGQLDPPPRILLLYGSLRERSYSRLAVEEAARLLQLFGCETRIFDPSDLPLPDQVDNDDHPAVHELREHSLWSEG